MKKMILIYGGSGGVGSALAKRISKKGVCVHLAGRNREMLAALSEELGAAYTVGDVKDPAFFEQATEAAGDRLDGLVYAVGTLNLGGLQRLEAEAFLADFQVNALGAALATKAALKLLKASGAGSVVLFSSVAADQGFAFHASMGMAKAAVSGLTRCLAAELAPTVRVNAIAPSLLNTPLAAPLIANEKTAEMIAKLHPLQRLGGADEVAALAEFLLSAAASWMTGQIVGIDGGRSTVVKH